MGARPGGFSRVNQQKLLPSNNFPTLMETVKRTCSQVGFYHVSGLVESLVVVVDILPISLLALVESLLGLV